MPCDRARLTAATDDGTRPLVVELLGVPGAGKTTIGRVLVDLLAEHGVRADTMTTAGLERAASSPVGRVIARRRPSRVRGVALWHLFSITAALALVRFGRAHRGFMGGVVLHQLRRDVPMSARFHIIRNFLRLCGRYRCVTAPSGATRALVLDDGFVHRSVQLHASAFDDVERRPVEDYVDRIPAPDLVVFVTASAETCERRVRERGVWRHSRRLTTAQLARYLENAGTVVAATASRARDRGWEVVQIENDGRALGDVRRELDDTLRSRRLWTAPSPTRVRATA